MSQKFDSKLVENVTNRYNSLLDIPVGYRDFVSGLLADGVLKGYADGRLDLSLDMIRCLLICDRMIDYYITL